MSILIFALLLFLGWLFPDHFPPWTAFHNEAPVFLGLALALAYDRAGGRGRSPQLQIGGAQVLLLVLVVLVWLQHLSGLLPFAGDAYLATAYLLGFGLAWDWARQSGDKSSEQTDWLKALAIAFVVGAFVSSCIALLQWTELEEVLMPWVVPADTRRVFGNLAQPNQLATLLLMGIVATMVLYQLAWLNGITSSLLVAVMTFVVVLTQSRTALLSAASLVLLAHLAPKLPQPLRVKKTAIWSWFIALLVLTWLLRDVWGDAVLLQPTEQKLLSPSLRPLMWKQLLAGLAQSPWWGYGWLQTATAQQQGALLVEGLEQTNYAHNLILDLVLWCGVPVGLTLVLICSWWLIARWRRARSANTQLLFAWLLPVGVHSMLEFPFAYAYFLFPTGILLGLIDRSTAGELVPLTSPIARASVRRLHTVAVAGFCALVVTLGWEYLKVEEDFRVTRFENRRIGHTPEEYVAPNLHLLTQWGALLHAMRLRAEPGMSEGALKMLESSARHYSWGALHFRYALALGLNGHPDDAAKQMRIIKGLFGPEMYAQAKEDFLREQHEKYPQLGEVQLP